MVAPSNLAYVLLTSSSSKYAVLKRLLRPVLPGRCGVPSQYFFQRPSQKAFRRSSFSDQLASYGHREAKRTIPKILSQALRFVELSRSSRGRSLNGRNGRNGVLFLIHLNLFSLRAYGNLAQTGRPIVWTSDAHIIPVFYLVLPGHQRSPKPPHFYLHRKESPNQHATDCR